MECPHVHKLDGSNALMIASFEGHHQIVELLMKEKVDHKYRGTDDGITALMLASLNGKFQVVEILLNAQADPNIQENEGLTALTTTLT